MSCRAPFQPEDQYEQLRRPNPGAGPNGVPLEQQTAAAAHLFSEYGAGAVGYAPSPYGAGPGPSIGGYPAVSPSMSDYGQSKLSATASIFVPNTVGNNQAIPNNNMAMGNRGGGGNGTHPKQYQRYANGYNHHHHQQQQPHHHHHHHQQQQQQHQSHQQHNNDMNQLASSVQGRLRINKQQQPHQQPYNGAMGNFYHQQQSQQHQVQQQHHHQQQHTQQPQQQPQAKFQQHFNNHQHHQYNNDMHQNKFQRHAHLNNSFQQIAQQPQQQPQQQQQQQPSTSSASSSSSSSHPDMATIALEYLDTVIHCLNQNPGQFDSIASRFLTIFDGMEQNQFVLSIAMEDIFEKSIEQPNFRYMGAKLYNLLHMLNPKADSLFHTLLKCKLEYHQSEVAKYMESTEHQQKVRETALFLAELYMQLRGEDDARLQLIAVNIVYSLTQLLACETNENVRCICQTLKLAGYDLTADCSQDMLSIIEALKAIEAKLPGKYPMAASVIALQANNWGRKVSNALGGDDDSAAVKEPPRLSDEPVFYGPDGRELTAEETDFLAAEDDDGSDDGDEFDVRDGDLDLDPEMDEETERAYKDFCKQSQSKAKKASS
ncbi:polyadenylate-binding protein-interacting protein 1 [Drosophila willistoni]|uniref:GK21392 n=1 Tax=Drosophila willistoni TaxID=7260 RepID=B4MQQ0_DROWI|nr:polyadenylate-binding protein-interacting protein 1 [Drosophila willistoni]